jgi:hypothetical protein
LFLLSIFNLCILETTHFAVHRNWLYHIFILTFFVLGNNQSVKSQSTVGDDALREDFGIIGDIIVGTYPKFTSADRQRITQLVAEKQRELEGQSLTIIEFFNFLIDIDFHTHFDEHAGALIPVEVLLPALEGSKLFPIPIRIIDDVLVVNSTESELPFGSQIYSINAVPVDSLIGSLTNNYSGNFVLRMLEDHFSLVYLVKKGSKDSYDISYAEPAALSDTLFATIKGSDFASFRRSFMNKVYPLDNADRNQVINSHYYGDSRTFYLQLNAFSLERNFDKNPIKVFKSEHRKFDKSFRSLFKQISELGAENLVLDLRHNNGGNVRVPGTLYKYIAKAPFKESIRMEIDDFDIPHMEYIQSISGMPVGNPKEVEKYLKKYKKYFEPTNGGYSWQLIDNEAKRPDKYAFQGDVYLLVGGKSISASSYFAAIFKANRRGTIVGEEMGGAYRSIAAGKVLSYQLPNTHLDLEAPIMLVNFSDDLCSKLGEGRIKPDIVLSGKETYQLYLQKKDVELERVMRLINP